MDTAEVYLEASKGETNLSPASQRAGIGCCIRNEHPACNLPLIERQRIQVPRRWAKRERDASCGGLHGARVPEAEALVGPSGSLYTLKS